MEEKQIAVAGVHNLEEGLRPTPGYDAHAMRSQNGASSIATSASELFVFCPVLG